MADAIAGSDNQSITGVANRIAEAGVLGARGNSGMMLSHFFLGFAEGLEGRARASAPDLAAAFRRAVDSLYTAVETPVEGTILTVVREFAEEAERLAGRIYDLTDVARRLLVTAQESLERTPELLPVLREAQVVDAGAKGFVCFLEGAVLLIDGRDAEARGPTISGPLPDVAAAMDFPEPGAHVFHYCSEFVVRASHLPERRVLAEAVAALGDSLIITRAPTLAKIHLHTDDPEEVEYVLSALGGSVERVKTEDMRAQHQRRRELVSRKLAIVTDTTCDLPPEEIIRNEITVVPLTVMFGDEVFLDQVDITDEEFFQLLVDPDLPPPMTSQPSPARLESSYRRAAEFGDEILGLFVSGALSGTLGQARAAAERFEDATVHVFDSRTASLGLGFQVLYAAELGQRGWAPEAVIEEIERIHGRSGILLTLDTVEYVRRSGRLGRARAFVANVLDLKPILSLDSEGAVVPVDRVRGREALIPRILQLLRQRIAERRSRLRIGVIHVMCPDVAEHVMSEMKREFAPDQAIICPATGVVAAHTGPGAWAVIYQAE